MAASDVLDIDSGFLADLGVVMLQDGALVEEPAACTLLEAAVVELGAA